MDIPKEGDHYQHFKGGKYVILAIAKDTEDIEKKWVVYRPIEDTEGAWVRTLENFTEAVDRPEYKGPRFIKM